MKKSNEEIKLVTDWLRFARENLLYARSGIKEPFSPFHTICFLCQGSAEKYLKAYLIYNGWKLEKIHDLVKLMTYCMEYNSKFENLNEECELLNEYIAEGRYPADIPFEFISKKNAEEAIVAAEKIEKAVLKYIEIKFEIDEFY